MAYLQVRFDTSYIFNILARTVESIYDQKKTSFYKKMSIWWACLKLLGIMAAVALGKANCFRVRYDQN